MQSDYWVGAVTSAHTLSLQKCDILVHLLSLPFRISHYGKVPANELQVLVDTTQVVLSVTHPGTYVSQALTVVPDISVHNLFLQAVVDIAAASL